MGCSLGGQRRAPVHMLHESTSSSSVLQQQQQHGTMGIEQFYTIKRKLGRGQYGVVFQGEHRRTAAQVAIKRLERGKVRPEYLTVEIAILKMSADCPYIVKFYEVFETKQYIFIIMEYMMGGELFDLLASSGAYSEAEAQRCIIMLLQAVGYLHANGVVHRDLKPENILLSERHQLADVKLADFGLSKMLANNEPLTSVCGTWAYSAPEMRDPRKPGYGFAIDLWSIGVIAYILLSGYHPFDPNGNASQGDMVNAILAGSYAFDDAVWTTISDVAKDFISKLLVVNPSQRLTAQEALQHQWLMSVAPGVSPTVKRDPLRKYAGEMRRRLKASVFATYAEQALASRSSVASPWRAYAESKDDGPDGRRISRHSQCGPPGMVSRASSGSMRGRQPFFGSSSDDDNSSVEDIEDAVVPIGKDKQLLTKSTSNSRLRSQSAAKPPSANMRPAAIAAASSNGSQQQIYRSGSQRAHARSVGGSATLSHRELSSRDLGSPMAGRAPVHKVHSGGKPGTSSRSHSRNTDDVASPSIRVNDVPGSAWV